MALQTDTLDFTLQSVQHRFNTLTTDVATLRNENARLNELLERMREAHATERNALRMLRSRHTKLKTTLECERQTHAATRSWRETRAESREPLHDKWLPSHPHGDDQTSSSVSSAHDRIMLHSSIRYEALAKETRNATARYLRSLECFNRPVMSSCKTDDRDTTRCSQGNHVDVTQSRGQYAAQVTSMTPDRNRQDHDADNDTDVLCMSMKADKASSPELKEADNDEEGYDQLQDESMRGAVWVNGPPGERVSAHDLSDEEGYDQLQDESMRGAVWINGPPGGRVSAHEIPAHGRQGLADVDLERNRRAARRAVLQSQLLAIGLELMALDQLDRET